MSKYNYSSKIENEHSAKAVGRDLNISFKHAAMVCNQLRNKNLLKSKILLNKVIEKKQAIPYTRFNKDRGHKKKIGPGRYPVKTCKAILSILENAESNAQFKGLNTSLLKIVHVNSHRASTPKRHGRKGGVSTKRSHVEVIVEEKAEMKKEDKKEKQETKIQDKPKMEKKQEKVKTEKKEIKIENKQDKKENKIKHKKKENQKVESI